VLIGLLFSMSANERQRQMAVFPVAGSNQGVCFNSTLTESSLLAVCGIRGRLNNREFQHLYL